MNKKADMTLGTMIGIILAIIVFLVLYQFYDLLVGMIGNIPD